MELEQYKTNFEEDAIDGNALLNLSENDLKELTVKMGHRKKILTLINEIKGKKKKNNKMELRSYLKEYQAQSLLVRVKKSYHLVRS